LVTPRDCARRGSEGDGAGELRVGVVADPGLPAKVAAALAAHGLAEHLASEIGSCPRWVVETVSAVLPVNEDGIVPLAELAAIRQRRQDWDVVVYLTDLPRRSGTQPVVADFSMTHAVALISLPAVGWVRLRRCVRDVVVYLLRRMAEERREHYQADRGHPEEVARRRLLPWFSGDLGLMVREAVSPHPDADFTLTLSGWHGRARLLFGMVRDNRPWVLVPHLASATAAAGAAAAVGIFYNSVWGMAEALPVWRLTLIMVASVTVMAVWLLIYNHLWDRPDDHHTPAEAVIYNLSTAVTLLLGVACMYGLLYVSALAVSALIIGPGYLQSQLHHRIGFGDYATIVWLASSIGVVAGALGSSLDGEEAVRKAAYSRRERERQTRNHVATTSAIDRGN
jgi:uncharacterized protein YggT (Ycf19 family)